ncbi:MAG: hypothetical protein HY791_29730 [Deltaproteobacteria bacterium]|nr:hypothetical protein [Deltaproteobacteria bacterium]
MSLVRVTQRPEARSLGAGLSQLSRTSPTLTQSSAKKSDSQAAPELRSTTEADRARVQEGQGSPLIAELLSDPAFKARIDLVRRGEPALLPEERATQEAALSNLSRAQLKALREVLVERPPHPRLPEMRGHPALKGPPSVAGILSILAGEPLGVATTRVAATRTSTLSGVASSFSSIFGAGKPVTARRSNGNLEEGWSIRGQSPDGKLVIEGSRGAVKLVSPKDLLELNPALLPPGLPVSVPRTQGSIDGGWSVAGPTSGGILVEKPGAHKTVTLEQLISTNESLLTPPKAHGLAGRVFPTGCEVKVTRSSGAVDSGWKISAFVPDSARVIVEKGGQAKHVPAGDLLTQNPELIPGGTPVRVPRTGGWTEDGWMALGPTSEGRIQVLGRGGERKAIPLAELLSANPELLAASELDGVRSGSPAKVTPGKGLEQSKSFLSTHRIPANQIIHDGFIDGGRGMQIHGQDVVAGREVLVVDRAKDTKLQRHLELARALQSLPEADRAKKLIAYVDNVFRPTEGNAEDAANRTESKMRGREVLIGEAADLGGGGACRHRALLFKLMGDEAGLDVALVRGGMQTASGRSGGHAWNELKLATGDRLMVDVMNPTQEKGEFILPPLKRAALGPSVYVDISGSPLY